MRKLLAIVLVASWTIVLVALRPAFAQQITDGHLIKPGTLPVTAAISPWGSVGLSNTWTGLNAFTVGLTGSGLPLTVTLVGNGATALTGNNFSATSASTSVFGVTSQISMISQTSGGANGNAALYTGLEAKAGTGNAWSINPLLTIDSGAGANSHNFQVLEVDLNNNDVDSNGGTAINGLDISGAGTHTNNTALDIAGNKNGGGPAWLYGVRSGSNNSVAGADYEIEGNGAWGLDSINFTGTSDIRLRNTGVIAARNASNSADVSLLSLNGSNVLQLGAGAASMTFSNDVNSTGSFYSTKNTAWPSGTWSASSLTQPIGWSGNAVMATSSTTTTCSQPCPVIGLQANQFQLNIGPTPAPNAELMRIYANGGGTNSVGGTTLFDVTELFSAPSGNTITGPNTNNANYQAINFDMEVGSGDNGTPSNYNGTFWGAAFYCHARPGALYIQSCADQENDISIAAGASAHFLAGVSVVLLSDNAVAPDLESFGFLVGAQGGAVPTLNMGLEFGGWSGQSAGAIASTGTLIGCVPNQNSGTCGGVAKGLDLTRWASFGTFQMAGLGGWSIDPSGNFIAPEFRGSSAIAKFYAPTTGAATVGNDTNGISARFDVDGGGGSTDYMDFHGVASGNSFTYLVCQGADTNVGCTFETKGNAPFIFKPGTDGDCFKIENAVGSATHLDVNCATSLVSTPDNFQAGNVITGALLSNGFLSDTNFDIQSITTAGSYTVPNGDRNATLDAGGTIGSYTVTEPASPTDGQVITVASTITITSFALNANGGQTMKCGPPTTLAAGGKVTCRYRASNTTWYPY